MISKNKIIHLFVGVIFLFIASNCNGCKEPEVTITKDYVINPNWDSISNRFEVRRLMLKDANDSIIIQRVEPPELLNKLEEDTSFLFVANVKYNGVDYSKRKVYFNRYNGFIWRKPPDIDNSRISKYNTIGKLQQNTWYLLEGLSNIKTLYYVYLDSKDSLHTFKVGAPYWTNY